MIGPNKASSANSLGGGRVAGRKRPRRVGELMVTTDEKGGD